MRAALVTLLVSFAIHAAQPARAAELLMFEEPGCVWCQRWHAEVGPGYPNSNEGQIAPLHRVDIRDGAPADIQLERKVTMTPTFVLVENGQERGRIVGYPGVNFFYPMLEELLKRLPPAEKPAPAPVQRDALNAAKWKDWLGGRTQRARRAASGSIGSKVRCAGLSV